MTTTDAMPAYSTTQVPVSRSQEEISNLLRRHGAASFTFGETVRGDTRYAGVEFEHRNLRVAMLVAVRMPSDAEADRIERVAKKKRGWLVPETWALQRTWRVIAWTLRARLVAVDEGVETFEQAFLAHIVNPRTGRTVYDDLAGDGRVELGPNTIPQLTTGGDHASS